MSLNRGPSIDASYQVSVHLATGFKRRRLKCEKLMNDRRRTPSDDKSSHCLWQGELMIRGRVYGIASMTICRQSGCRGRVCMVVRFTTTYMQSVPITTDVMISNLDQGKVYNIIC